MDTLSEAAQQFLADHPDAYTSEHDGQTLVAFPRTNIGYGASSVEVANFDYIERDTRLIERLNLVYRDTQWNAVIDNFDEDQAEELADWFRTIQEYAVISDHTHNDIVFEDQLESLSGMLSDYEAMNDTDTGLNSSDILDIIIDDELYFVEEDNRSWYISEEDFTYAIGEALKQREDSVN